MGDSWANLPPQILVLLHVVNRIKELALTPKGAVEMAARMNQIQWLEQLLSDFECDVSDAVVEAAGVGRVDLLKILVPKRNIFVEYDIDGDPCFYDGESDDNDGFLADAAVAAAKHGHLEAVEFLVCKIIRAGAKMKLCGEFWMKQQLMDMAMY
ncbi:hypothetical protein JG687_00017828 [Phytophthora cactorum]|uniref:Ankyrin repeat-containing domain n=1 Tax=Phytophthora cactorum TaxID=29920 RepID=A0A8T1TMB4_9STRA|nr:hypothetical protein JG687_00017828 [Phytophthora cactorum]